MFGALLLAVLVRESVVAAQRDGVPWRQRLVDAARTQWLILLALAGVLAIGVHLLAGGTATLGDYGTTATADGIWDRLFGDTAETTRRSAMSFVRSLVQGGFVFPFALGIGAALAATAGRLGRRLIVPGLLTLVSVPLVIASVVLAASAQEERYAFYPAALIALFAVTAVEHVRRLSGWLTAGAVIAVWALLTGAAQPGGSSFDFFHAPAGAFWTRVLDARLRDLEGDLLGWTLLPRTGWLLFAAGLVAMVVVVRLLAARRARLVHGLLAGGLAACAVMQVVAMQYGFKQELHGTTTAPGGIAGAPGHDERATDVDAALPGGADAMVVPALIRPGAPFGETEHVEMWSKAITTVAAMPWNGAPVPASAGMTVLPTVLGPDGLARPQGTPPRWLVAIPDDPRMQFAADQERGPGRTAFAVWRLRNPERARWTAAGLGADGGLPAGVTGRLTLDTRTAPVPAGVRLTLAPTGSEPARFTLTREGRRVARGRLVPGATRDVTLRLPDDRPDHVTWTLRSDGLASLVAVRIRD